MPNEIDGFIDRAKDIVKLVYIQRTGQFSTESDACLALELIKQLSDLLVDVLTPKVDKGHPAKLLTKEVLRTLLRSFECIRSDALMDNLPAEECVNQCINEVTTILFRVKAEEDANA